MPPPRGSASISRRSSPTARWATRRSIQLWVQRKEHIAGLEMERCAQWHQEFRGNRVRSRCADGLRLVALAGVQNPRHGHRAEATRGPAFRATLMAAGLLGLLGLRATGAATFATATTTPQGALSTTRTLRLRGCDGHSGIRAPLRSNAALNAAAAQWSRGGKLKAAIERSGYREDQSAGLHLSGTAQALSDA